ncbi:aminotransferase class I/II-fold pyridoxal phosphate-dependent enzyme [Paenarthrobacter sp. NPDC091669]|uniref:aminotransferase class I/II-fold pyridoxal phosphate-dependent enzyme n=1 Tax=Paenarthrobacter sp. NPDC091669 TaxID=3364384 RepID=UPI00380C142B
MGTLLKSLSSSGGYIAGDADLVAYLRGHCPAYVFATALAPVSAAAASAALSVIDRGPHRLRTLQQRVSDARAIANDLGLDKAPPQKHPSCPVILGERGSTLESSFTLFRRGLLAHPPLYPATQRPGAAALLHHGTTHRGRATQCTDPGD